jgi:acyl-CoA dehydrogenase
MSWDFETDASYQEQLQWADIFVRQEVEPLEYVLGSPHDLTDPIRNALILPLQAEVKARGLWACHIRPELGGQGYGQVKLALLNEILGRSPYAPTVFGCQAPDSGNAEILAHFGTAEQKKRYLEPLLDNRIISCFAMTEPQGGADPRVFTCCAVRDGNDWVINGEKWFASNARYASFFIVMAVTDSTAPIADRMSMFIVPAGTAGLKTVRDLGVTGEPVESHAHLRFLNVRVPADSLLAGVGKGFHVAQVRLGGGRVHHAMRAVGLAGKAFEMMCERVKSRYTQGGLLADKQMVQEKIADSWIELEQFRLLVMRTAWLIDKHKDYKRVIRDIAAVKAATPKLLHDIAVRALHLHGSLGVSLDMPFTNLLIWSEVLGLADGPTEVHKISLAKQVLGGVAPSADPARPAYGRVAQEAAARAKFAGVLADLAPSIAFVPHVG